MQTNVQRDWVLLFCITGISLVSSGTTILGAKQILPSPMAEVIGVSVQTMLYLLLTGMMMSHSVVRRWFGISVFTVISIYTSFFTYYEELGSEADAADQIEEALIAHAALVSDLYSPIRNECDRLMREADALTDATELEARGGSMTGISGYGPVARKMAREASAKRLAAMEPCSVADRLQPLFEIDVEGITPDELFRSDLAAWQQAPDRNGSVAPERATYVDLDAQVALLTPFHRVLDGQLTAIVAFVLALLVDGSALVLGTAVVVPAKRRDGWPWRRRD